ncbi:MAG: hypothetical protein ACM3VZ_14885 [Acidobacteriota bacterium]
MTCTLTNKGLVIAMGMALSTAALATVPAGTQLPLKAADKQVFKVGDLKRVKFLVAASDETDKESLISRLAGCTIEGDAAYNPRSARLYVKNPVLTCSPETKMGAAFLGGSIMGQLSDSGLEGIRLDCPTPKECTMGSLKKDAEAAFTVTETMGGGE